MSEVQPEEQIAKLLEWYREAKKEFIPQAYLSKGNDFYRLLNPHTDWNSRSTLNQEFAFALRAQAKLKDQLKGIDSTQQKSLIALAVLSLKNRIENASNISDFYPVYVGFVTFAFALISLTVPGEIKLVYGIASFLLIAFPVRTRVLTRRHVGEAKEIVNLLEAYEKQVLAKSAA